MTPVSTILQESTLLRGDTPGWVQRQSLRLALDGEIGKNKQKGIATSVYFKDNTRGHTLYRYQIDREYYAASVNKLLITLLLLEDLRSGKVALNDTVKLPVERIEGAGRYDEGDNTREVTIKQALEDMLKHSGNTVARPLVAQLGGAKKVNERLAQDENLGKTRLIERKGSEFWLGNTTARESLYMMNRVAEKQDKYGEIVQKALTDNIFDDYGVKAQLSRDYIVLTNKMGQLSDEKDGDVRHDVGVIYNAKTGERYSFAILNRANPEVLMGERPIDPSQAIGKRLLDYAQ